MTTIVCKRLCWWRYVLVWRGACLCLGFVHRQFIASSDSNSIQRRHGSLLDERKQHEKDSRPQLHYDDSERHATGETTGTRPARDFGWLALFLLALVLCRLGSLPQTPSTSDAHPYYLTPPAPSSQNSRGGAFHHPCPFLDPVTRFLDYVQYLRSTQHHARLGAAPFSVSSV